MSYLSYNPATSKYPVRVFSNPNRVKSPDAAGEPYLDNVILLLRMDEVTIVDASPTPKTLTIVGDPTINSADFKTGTASRNFAGFSSYLTVTDPELALGADDWTIEAWIKYPTLSPSNNGLFTYGTAAFSSAGFGLARYNNTFFVLGTGLVGATINTYAPINVWHHYAHTKTGGQCKLWINGVERASIANTTNYTQTFWTIGGYSSASFCWNGQIDSFRITKGIARYTSNFDPETDTFLT